jgi:hypothetical protein
MASPLVTGTAANERFVHVQDLADSVAEDPQLEAEIKADPVRALHRRAAAPPEDTRGLVLMVILAAIAALVIVAAIVFAFRKETVPPELIALGSAALGGLVGTRIKG